MRASSVVKRQSTLTRARLRRSYQARALFSTVSMVGVRPLGHCRLRTDSADSAELSQFTVFRCEVPLNPADNAAGLGRVEALVQAGWVVDVQAIHHEDNPLGVGIDLADQVAQDVRKVKTGSPRPNPYAPESAQGFQHQKKRAGAMTLIFLILPPGLSRLEG